MGVGRGGSYWLANFVWSKRVFACHDLFVVAFQQVFISLLYLRDDLVLNVPFSMILRLFIVLVLVIGQSIVKTAMADKSHQVGFVHLYTCGP